MRQSLNELDVHDANERHKSVTWTPRGEKKQALQMEKPLLASSEQASMNWDAIMLDSAKSAANVTCGQKCSNLWHRVLEFFFVSEHNQQLESTLGKHINQIALYKHSIEFEQMKCNFERQTKVVDSQRNVIDK